jgi:hypothetical protein
MAVPSWRSLLPPTGAPTAPLRWPAPTRSGSWRSPPRRRRRRSTPVTGSPPATSGSTWTPTSRRTRDCSGNWPTRWPGLASRRPCRSRRWTHRRAPGRCAPTTGSTPACRSSGAGCSAGASSRSRRGPAPGSRASRTSPPTTCSWTRSWRPGRRPRSTRRSGWWRRAPAGSWCAGWPGPATATPSSGASPRPRRRGTSWRPNRWPDTTSWLRDVVLRAPWLIPSAVVYVSVVLLAERRRRSATWDVRAGWGRAAIPAQRAPASEQQAHLRKG